MDLKSWIIANIDQRIIFSKYLNIHLDDINNSIVNHIKICNNYRNETHPSLSFRYYGEKLISRDFGDSRFSGDVFEVVGYITNNDFRNKYGFVDICEHIIKTCSSETNMFYTIKKEEQKELNKKDTIIEYVIRTPTNRNYDFYKQFGITEEYFNKNIDVVDSYYINNKFSSYKYSNTDPCYAYRVNPNKTKLYFPFRTKCNTRFITNNRVIIENLDKLSDKDYTIIIKSIKDKILFDRILNEKGITNIQVLSSASETVKITKQLYKILLKHTNSRKIYSLFDSDNTGITNMKHLEETLGIIPIYFTLGYNSKDPTDMCKQYGYNKVFNHFDIIFKNIL